MFQYIINWWYYDPQVEEEKTIEKIEVKKKNEKVLKQIVSFDKNTLRRYKPLTPLQKMKKARFRKKRKRKQTIKPKKLDGM